MSTFSSNLECLLISIGMTQYELAQRSGLTQAAVSQLISGDREPMVSTLLRICAALKTTPNDLLSFYSESDIERKNEICQLKLKIDRAIKHLQK